MCAAPVTRRLLCHRRREAVLPIGVPPVMRVRHLALPTLTAAVIALGTLTVPASAAEAPPFGVWAKDTATPGQAPGTVTTHAA